MSGNAVDPDQGALDQRIIPPMGMTGQQFQDVATSTINEIERYYSNIQDRPVLPAICPGYLQKLLPEHAPEHGESWADISKDIERTIMPGMTHWQSPKYMAFFPANSTYPGILGEMWSAALTAPAFNWICSPAVTELETIVLDWLAQALGLPEAFLSKGEGGGVIQGSASEAVVTVMVAARERYVRRQLEREGVTDPDEAEDRACNIRSELVALGSDQAHSSTKKAAVIAGTRFRTVPTSRRDAHAMTGDSLRRTLDTLASQGLHPFFLTATIGTTNTCAVDDLASIAAVAHSHPDLWLHCDAAYAGAALVLPEHRPLAAPLRAWDSVNMNMHKWLLANFDASPLWVRRRRDLTDALAVSPAYLRNAFSDSGLVTDYRDWQIPLGRRFRALKIWFVLRTWGVDGLRRHVRHHIALGELFARLVRSRADLFGILTPPAFALTVLTVNARRGAVGREGETSGEKTLDETSAEKTSGETSAEKTSGETSAEKTSGETTAEKTSGGTSAEMSGEKTTAETSGKEPPSEEQQQANDNTRRVYATMEEEKEFFLTSSEIDGVTAIRVVSANPLAEEKYVRRVFDRLVAAAERVLA